MLTLFATAAGELPRLQRSPTFAMSRGGRELFHTNFWGFILEVDPNDLDDADRPIATAVRDSLLQSLFGPEHPSQVLVWREKANLDLVVVAVGDGQVLLPDAVVVEMKLKAIPTPEQLDAYTRKLHAGVTFDLPEDRQTESSGRLSVKLAHRDRNEAEFRTCPLPGRKSRASVKRGGRAKFLLVAPGANACTPPWGACDLAGVIEAMNTALTGARTTQGGPPGLFTSIVEDDLRSTRQLLSIIDGVQKDTIGAVDANTLRLDDLQAAIVKFKAARLHDVVGKQAYSVLQMRLLRWLKEQPVVSTAPGGFTLQGETFMTRGTAGLNVEYAWRREATGQVVRIGVQIQGTLLRRYVSASHAPEKLLASTAARPDVGAWLAMCGPAKTADSLNFFGKNVFAYRQTPVGDLRWPELRNQVADALGAASRLLTDDGARDALTGLAPP